MNSPKPMRWLISQPSRPLTGRAAAVCDRPGSTCIAGVVQAAGMRQINETNEDMNARMGAVSTGRIPGKVAVRPRLTEIGSRLPAIGDTVFADGFEGAGAP